MKIATVVYDNNSSNLGFNFKSIDEVLDDGFQQILKQRQRRNTQGMWFGINYPKSFLPTLMSPPN
jgi:hypothetical protein